VNLLGHTHVALASGRDDPGWLLGAVLPDLTPIAGVRVDRAALPDDVAAGVRCHLAADAAFHALPAFVLGSAGIRRALDARGAPSGAARAVGHAGWELLLDGTLVRSATEEAFHAAMAQAGAASAAMSAADARRWAAFVDRGRPAPTLAYDDPAWVAERLHALLARRPRLRLPQAWVPVVAEVLESARPAVVAAAAAVLRTTARATRRAS
jgi:hypothetical protein